MQRETRRRLAWTEVGLGGVCGVWYRQGIETCHKRLIRLEQHAQGDTIMLSKRQNRMLERHSAGFRRRHIKASQPRRFAEPGPALRAQPQGVGQVYLQVVADVLCSPALAKAYTANMPVAAAGLLYERAPSFYEALRLKIGATLTDNGREFCGI